MPNIHWAVVENAFSLENPLPKSSVWSKNPQAKTQSKGSLEKRPKDKMSMAFQLAPVQYASA